MGDTGVGNDYNVEIPTQALPKPVAKDIKALMASMVSMKDKKAAGVPLVTVVSGDQGTGKTTSTVKLIYNVVAPDKRIIYMDSAQGWSTLMNDPQFQTEDFDNRVKWMQYENMEQQLILAAAIRDKVPPFDTIGGVILDEYSSMVKKDRTWIVKARSQQKEKKNEGFKDPFQPSQPDYLASQIRSEEVINAYLATGIHIGFTSHEKLDKDTLQIRPDFSPGAGNDLQRLVHSVLRASTKVDKSGNVTRQLQLQPFGRVSAKNRIGGMGNFASDIMEVVEAYKKWGIQKEPVPTTLTKEEVEVIEKDDELLSLLNKQN